MPRKNTIGDKIKKCAKNPIVQENRRKLRAMYYISKNPKNRANVVIGKHTFHNGWVADCTVCTTINSWKFEYKFVDDTIQLLPLSHYDFNGNR